ncbi:hypothetical protein [Caballeronia glebae]|jgi:hypothetical protein|uniref:hypothetical protein n=1 Tax=Caballeronia glebae TaxID=1777143 RepID=UPI0038BB956A
MSRIASKRRASRCEDATSRKPVEFSEFGRKSNEMVDLLISEVIGQKAQVWLEVSRVDFDDGVRDPWT